MYSDKSAGKLLQLEQGEQGEGWISRRAQQFGLWMPFRYSVAKEKISRLMFFGDGRVLRSEPGGNHGPKEQDADRETAVS